MKRYLGTVGLGTVGLLGALSLLVTLGGKDTSAASTPSNSEIYSVRIDGTGKRNLTRNPRDDFAPAVSPNGGKIAFVRASTSGNWDLWIMDADGTHQRRLTDTEDAELDPVWSPNGNLIAFTLYTPRDNGWYTVWVVAPDGSGLRRVGEELHDGRYPRWSPDGSRLAFETGIDSYAGPSSIGVAELSGASWELPIGRAWPSWSPSGQRISAFGGNDDEGTVGIHVTAADGSSSRRVVRRAFHPEWSPTRSLIAFHSHRSHRVRVISSRGGHITRLASADRFAWERNGRRLILFRSRGDIREVDSDGRHRRVILRKPGVLDDRGTIRVTPWVTSPDDRRLYFAAEVTR